MKCHFVYDKKIGKVHIPYCWAAVIHGPKYCTCHDYPETFEEFENEKFNKVTAELRKKVKDLEQYNARLQRIIKKLIKNK